MKINGNQVRPGNVLEIDGKLLRVSKIAQTQPGKGGAYTQAELKDIITGNKTNLRFRSSETVERAVLEQRPMQYLFNSGDALTFMDMQSYDQVEIHTELLGDQEQWLQENMEVVIEMHEGNAIGVELPDSITMQVTEAEPVVKGQTASSSYKPAVVENGATVMVPPFVEAGIKININPADGSYIGRA